METIVFPTTAAEIGAVLDAPVIGDSAANVERLSSLQTAEKGCLSFFSNRKYSEFLSQVQGAVLFTSADLVRPELPITFIVVGNPQEAFAKVAKSFSPDFSWHGIAASAVVSSEATIGTNVHVGAFTIIEAGVRIGSGTRIHPYCYIGRDAVIGNNCEFHARATVGARVRIGDRVKVFPGTVIGYDGFGFFQRPGSREYFEMPQIGTVVIEDDVRIGANCTIDRGTLGETFIGKGSKLDDQVHVGHNCRVGRDCILCAQVGLGGSTILEDDVVLGGQVGLGHGITVGEGARMGGQSGSSVNIPGKETYFLTPALPVKETMRLHRYFRKLPEIWKRLKTLEVNLIELKEGKP